MKKVVTVVLSLVLILGFFVGFSLISFAEEGESYDSFNVDPALISKYQEAFGDPETIETVLHIGIATSATSSFRTGLSVDRLVEYLRTGKEILILKKSGDMVEMVESMRGDISESPVEPLPAEEIRSLLEIRSRSELFSGDFVVQNTFLFVWPGEESGNNVLVIRTNQGDFSLVKASGDAYLLPWIRYQQAVALANENLYDNQFNTDAIPWLSDYAFDGTPLTLAKYQEQMAKEPVKSQLIIYEGVQWSDFASGRSFANLKSSLNPVFLERRLLNTDSYVYRNKDGDVVSSWPQTAGAKVFLSESFHRVSVYSYFQGFSFYSEETREEQFCRMESPGVGICIGVKIEQWDFMLYKPSAEAKEIYLLPYEHFCELAKTVKVKGGDPPESARISPELLAPYLTDDTGRLPLSKDDYLAMMNFPEESTDNSTEKPSDNATDKPADGSGERTSSRMPMGILGGVLILLVAGTAIVLLPLGKKERR